MYYGPSYYEPSYYSTSYYGRSTALGPSLSRTFFTLLQEARSLLLDTRPNMVRYTDEMLLNALNRGLHEIGRHRPDAYYELFQSNSLSVPEATQVNWGQPFPLELRFYSPLVFYVVGSMDSIEDEYTVTPRSSSKIQLFYNMLKRV